MRQLLLGSPTSEGARVVLSDRDSHYLRNVLRLRDGDAFEILDQAGSRFLARVADVSASGVNVIVESPIPDAGEEGSDACRITLFQALPKGRKFDDVIRAVVQAGVSRIVPITTERTVVRPRDDDEGRLNRWARVAREAVQQSGAPGPVEVGSIVPVGQIHASEGAVSIMLHTSPLAQSTLHGYLDRVPDRVELVVGPEGGFTPDETDLLRQRGFAPLYLGSRILRTETAGVFALGAVRILLEERNSWRLVN